jgi:hypothetical protein
MAVLDLRLFGVPRLFLDGEEVVISRPRVFECLARIIVAGPDGITRSELCRKLWPDFDLSDSRAQLRGTLMKLRAELEKVSIAGQFELSGETVRVVGAISCDLTDFTKNPLSDESHIRTAVQRDNWQVESDQVAESLSTVFESTRKFTDAIGHVDLLKRAVESHPTSTRLVTILVSRLERLNRIDEANQAIIAFEDAWVDRFGSADLPRISINQNLAETIPVTTPRRKLKTLALLLSPIVVVAFLSILAPTKNPVDSLPPRKSDIRIASSHVNEISGQKVVSIEFTTGPSRVASVSRFSDGGVNICTSKDHSEIQNILEPNGRVFIGPQFPAILKDRSEEMSLVSETPYSATWNDGHSVVRMTGTKELAYFNPVQLLQDREILAVRTRDDPFRSRVGTLITNGVRVDLIRPSCIKPQIVYPTFWGAKHIFLSYSMGSSEGWKYHSMEYDLESRSTRSLPYAKVAYESSGGTLVVLPEETSIRNGDYDTHWDGRVFLVRKGRDPEEITIHGAKRFEFVGCFGDSLLIQTSHTNASRIIHVLPIEYSKHSPSIPRQVADIFISPDNRALIYRQYDKEKESNKYILLNQLSH